MRIRCVLGIIVAFSTAAVAQSPEGNGPRAVLVEGTGEYSRPISTSSELAQEFFDQGLRLTWGYYFPDAAASFLEALRHDPDHPMIYWGLALATGPNPNSRYMGLPDDPEGEGKRAIEAARRNRARATEKERAFIDALYVRHDTETHPGREERGQAYLEAARALAERFPGDGDAVALYADAFMTSSPWEYWDRDGAPMPGTLEVAAALERVIEGNRTHPGANHLYIHLFEASLEPERALPHADRLEALMPKAGHIVHMPSHIYVRVGDYARSIASNERSVAADEAFMSQWGDTPFPSFTTYPLSATMHATHAKDFIRYSATVQGNYETALELARGSEEVVLRTRGLDNGRAQRTVATVWLVHKIFGKWDALLEEAEGAGPPKPGYPYLDGMWHYARGSADVGRGRLAEARKELDALEEVLSAEEEALGGLLVMANPASKILKIAALGLEGEIAQGTGELDAAIDAFEAAVELEDSLGYMEPPDWAQPMRHYLGAALVEAGHHQRAERVYREDLEWTQNNGWALYGLWQSLRGQGRDDEAEKARARFEDAWSGVDVMLERSRF